MENKNTQKTLKIGQQVKTIYGSLTSVIRQTGNNVLTNAGNFHITKLFDPKTGNQFQPVEQTEKDVNPFGRLHDYISVQRSNRENRWLNISDGTHEIDLIKLQITPNANWSKPYQIVGKDTRLQLTRLQVVKLLEQLAGFIQREDEEDKRLMTEEVTSE